jgi:hypothetical protein
MTYASGVASTANQLIDAIYTFAQANGWTIKGYTTDGAGYRLHINKGDIWANLSSNYSPSSYTFGIKGSTGYSAASTWDNQPGTSSSVMTCPKNVGTVSHALLPCTWHLFAQSNPDLLTGVFVSPSQANSHFAVGQLVKTGIFNTGAFYSGHQFWAQGNTNGFSHTLAVRAEVDTYQWLGTGGSLAIWRDGPSELTNQFNSLAPLLPIRVFYQPASNGILLGFLPHMRTVHMQGFNNADTFTIGSDDWMVFFRSDRQGNATGLAIRK